MPVRIPHSHLLLTAALCLLGTLPAWADGVPVGPAPGEAQAWPGVASDGHGGATVTYKTTLLHAGAVHVNASGAPDGGFAFGPSALPLALETGSALRTLALSDSQLLVVSDHSATADPALTCVRNAGSATAGFPVALAMPLRHPALVPGLAGRTLLVANDADGVYFWTLRAAIVAPGGQVEFAVQLSSPIQFFDADPLDACSDGAGGLLAAIPFYDQSQTGSKDIAIWKLAADGSRPWGDRAIPAINTNNDQNDVHVVPDGAGGMIMVWADRRSATRSSDIYALRIGAGGIRDSGWPFYGTAVCNALGAQTQPRITADGLGGVWIVWLDQRAGRDGELRYSHLLRDGSLAQGFTSDGTSLCAAGGARGEATLAGDGAGGFFAVWRDDRSGNPDIYAQHVMATGLVADGWSANGRPLTTAPGAQDQPAIAGVSGGKVVVVWRDARAGTTRIYATGITDLSVNDVAPGGADGLRLAPAGAIGAAARVRLSLPAGPPGVLELLDIGGRVRARTALDGPIRGQVVTLSPAGALEPGLYFARLRQGAAAVSARVTLLR